jgi:hypothetical protein
MTTPRESARDALESFLAAWNRADIESVRAELNYPHVTLGPQGQVILAREPSDFLTDFARMREREGWDHSSFDDYTWIAESADKVHCEVTFSRFRGDGTCYGRGKVLYAVTNHNGHWGMQMRSGMPDGMLSAATRG